MKMSWALRILYSEVLKEGLKVRVIRGPILGPKGSKGEYVYELETYTERGYWIFKTKWPRRRYYMRPDGATHIRVYPQ